MPEPTTSRAPISSFCRNNARTNVIEERNSICRHRCSVLAGNDDAADLGGARCGCVVRLFVTCVA